MKRYQNYLSTWFIYYFPNLADKFLERSQWKAARGRDEHYISLRTSTGFDLSLRIMDRKDYPRMEFTLLFYLDEKRFGFSDNFSVFGNCDPKRSLNDHGPEEIIPYARDIFIADVNRTKPHVCTKELEGPPAFKRSLLLSDSNPEDIFL